MQDTQNKKLNSEQKLAINHSGGPLLIIAGAGTGKTTVITERISYLVQKQNVISSQILALTFTEKAAQEMQDRVDEVLAYGLAQMWILTFHGYCDRVLRREALQIGLDPQFNLMSTAENMQFLKQNLFQFSLKYFRPMGNPHKFLSGLLQHFSRLQDEDITADQYCEWAEKQRIDSMGSDTSLIEESEKWVELSQAYKKYEELKAANGVLDFGDLIVKTLSLFRSRPSVLAGYRSEFKHLLIDEFQDTNFAQMQLALLLTGDDQNITVVGDDDQSIYRFRGAAISNMIQFTTCFPKATVIVLNHNYRSGRKILDRAYDLIQFNNPDRLEVAQGINKKLKAVRDIKSTVSFIHTNRVENEADEVAKKITELIDGGKYRYQDIAILVRANSHAEPFTRALARHGIPSQFLGPGRLYKQPEVFDLISYLRFLSNIGDSLSLYRVLSMEQLKISAIDIAKLGSYSKVNSLSLFEVCEQVSNVSVSEETIVKVENFISMVQKHLQLVREETAGQILYYFLQDIGLLETLISAQTVEAEKHAVNITKFFDKLKSYEANHSDASIASVVDWIDISSEIGESPTVTDTDWNEVPAVNILTVHSSKGLEFPIVFMVNLVHLRFPSTERREQIPIPEKLIREVLPSGDFHIQEERRLFYVGMTRAQDHLFLTAADFYGEGKRAHKLSNFVNEAIGEEVSRNKTLNKSEKQNLENFSIQNTKIDDSVAELKIDYLSYSQIETFKLCPLHYKLRYLIKIPSPATASQSFGISIHATLKDFYDQCASGTEPSAKLLISLLSDHWIKKGYVSKVQEAEFIEKGKIYLSGFYQNYFDEGQKPSLLEHKFLLPLPKRDGVSPLKIGGVIDRVDVLTDGTIEILDYKTGATIPTQKEVDNNDQLTFYALAAFLLNAQPPFDDKGKNIRLSLYYLDQQVKISTTRSKMDLEKMIDDLYDIRDQIQKSDFRCSNNYFCQSCEFKSFCSVE